MLWATRPHGVGCRLLNGLGSASLARSTGEYQCTIGGDDDDDDDDDAYKVACRIRKPLAVAQDEIDRTFVVVNCGNNNLVKYTREGEVLGALGHEGADVGAFHQPCAAAVLANGGLVVREYGGSRFQVFLVGE